MTRILVILISTALNAAALPLCAAGTQHLPQAVPQQAAADPAQQKAVRMAIDGRYQEASSAFRRLLRRKPDDPLLLYYLGLCYAKMQRDEAAVTYLGRAVEEDAPFPQAFYWLAEVHLGMQEVAKARQALEDGLAEFPRNEDLLELRSRIRPVIDPP